MILGKRRLSKRMTKKYGRNIYKVRKAGRKNSIATVKTVAKMIKGSQEIKHVTGQGEGSIYQFPQSAASSMPGSRIQPMQVWPAQGDNQGQRDGKQIKNVTASYLIKFVFYICQQKATQTVSDLLPYHTWRVIIWTTNQDVDLGASFPDFFRMNTNSTNGVDLLSVNKNRITVLKDKVYNIMNPHYHPGSTPINSGVLTQPICAVRYLKVKRRWKTINFPTNASNETTKASNYTYMSVLPQFVNKNFVSPDTMETYPIGFYNLRSIVYFTD